MNGCFIAHHANLVVQGMAAHVVTGSVAAVVAENDEQELARLRQ